MGLYAALPLLAGTIGDIVGGWLSDRLLKRNAATSPGASWCAIGGFLLAAAGDRSRHAHPRSATSVWFSCLAVFGLELTVGVSWAVPLDIGGDYAGSVSAVMNTAVI